MLNKPITFIFRYVSNTNNIYLFYRLENVAAGGPTYSVKLWSTRQ